MAKGIKGFGNWMTKAINSIDGIGWGRSGAAAGAVAGGVYGGVSDNGTVLGGAAKGSVIGFGAGKLARFGSVGYRDKAQLQTYADKSMNMGLNEAVDTLNNGIKAAGGAYQSVKATASAAFP